MWGDAENMETIVVGGKPLTVRDNCYHALWQVRHHYPNESVWIDSVCIDQSDLSEKGPQVAMMEAIYTTASCVCACVGRHDDSSRQMVAILNEYHKCEIDYPHVNFEPEQDGCTVAWFWSLARNLPAGFAAAVLDFCHRPYWSRLWILQEIRASAGNSLDILCGPHVIDFAEAVCLCESVKFEFASSVPLDRKDNWTDNHMLDISTMLQTKQKFLGASSMDAVIMDSISIEDFSCLDPRSLWDTFDWAQSGLAIVPDYNLSTLDLAYDLILRLRDPYMEDVDHIVRILRLKDEDLDEWRSSRNDKSDTSSERKWEDKILSTGLTYLNEAGELSSDFRGCPRVKHGDETQEPCTHFAKIKTGPKSWIHADGPLLPGDILVATKDMAFALRPCSSAEDPDMEVVARLRCEYVTGYDENNLSDRHTLDLPNQCRCFEVETCADTEAHHETPFHGDLHIGMTMSKLSFMELVICGRSGLQDGSEYALDCPIIGSTVRDISWEYIISTKKHDAEKNCAEHPLVHLSTCPFIYLEQRETMIAGNDESEPSPMGPSTLA